MIARYVQTTTLVMGVALGSAGLVWAGDEARPPVRTGGDGSVKRLTRTVAEAEDEAIEEVCRRRRLFRRGYVEAYSAPPVVYSAPAVEYPVPPAYNPPPEVPADPPRYGGEPPTLPAPRANTSAAPTFPYDGGPTPSAPVAPSRLITPSSDGPTLGPTPNERMVSVPKPTKKPGYGAYGDDRPARRSDTRVIRGTGK